eukprot:271265-Rhodomonas_salina.5
MSGTDIAHSGISLSVLTLRTAYGSIFIHIPYAMSGTDTAYSGISLRAPYAISGTDLAYGGTSERTS